MQNFCEYAQQNLRGSYLSEETSYGSNENTIAEYNAYYKDDMGQYSFADSNNNNQMNEYYYHDPSHGNYGCGEEENQYNHRLPATIDAGQYYQDFNPISPDDGDTENGWTAIDNSESVDGKGDEESDKEDENDEDENV